MVVDNIGEVVCWEPIGLEKDLGQTIKGGDALMLSSSDMGAERLYRVHKLVFV